jgi:hypothetical protein
MAPTASQTMSRREENADGDCFASDDCSGGAYAELAAEVLT